MHRSQRRRPTRSSRAGPQPPIPALSPQQLRRKGNLSMQGGARVPTMKMDRVLTKRIRIVVVTMGLWALIISGRLYLLHVVHSADYKQRAERQQQRTIEVSPRRG